MTCMHDDVDDDVVFPSVCEENIEVITQVGIMTDLSLKTKEAIRIVSQDCSTVMGTASAAS